MWGLRAVSEPPSARRPHGVASGEDVASLSAAYHVLEWLAIRQDPKALHQVIVLSYTPQADALYHDWRHQRIRVSTHDLRSYTP